MLSTLAEILVRDRGIWNCKPREQRVNNEIRRNKQKRADFVDLLSSGSTVFD